MSFLYRAGKMARIGKGHSMKSPLKKLIPGKAQVIPSTEKGLGTFGGVFTPSILTILGVIMYLRFGWFP